MTTALASDPYVLPMPSPVSPVVLSRWISPGNTHANSLYAEAIWPMAPLIDNPGTSLVRIRWKNCPAVLLDQVKLTAWSMINGELRPTYLATRGVRARGRASAPAMQVNCLEWMRLARFLNKCGVTDLANCTGDRWAAYAAQRWTGKVGRGQAERILGRLTDLWAYDQLSARPSGISRPPWDTEGLDDFLPSVSSEGGGENSTEALDPQVIGPLLVWAIRMVEDFADDILAAWAENRRLSALVDDTPSTPTGVAALTAYLRPLIEAGAPLPSISHGGTTAPCLTFISAITGASYHQVDRFAQRHGLGALTAERPGPCPLEVPVTGRIEGRPWRERMDFTEASVLMRHLGTAAMIVCTYLTGMRPQEIQGLRSGCCPDPEPNADGTPQRHLIFSHHYKNVTDDDGNHVSGGEEREVPWTAILPVVHAIRVLERIVPAGELLLSAAHHDFRVQRGHHGALKGQALNQRIQGFVAWVNAEALAQDLPNQAIPEDPYGKILMARFRRSLAWHVARRPGGLIALAIQYGHLRTVLDARVSSGYGSRSRRGIHSVLDIETVLAAGDTAAGLRDRLAAGEKISGPGSRRALVAVANPGPRFEGRIVPNNFAQKAADHLARDGIVLFDNPDSYLICAFKRENARCDPAPGATAPNQPFCQRGCGNIVRTDSHARGLREHARDIEVLAAGVPEPAAKRMRANAAKHYADADAHDATAQSAEDLACPSSTTTNALASETPSTASWQVRPLRPTGA